MSITANYLYNILYQLITIAIPFITVPYVSRVLGTEGIGINAYAGSILQYFMLFGSLGIGLYASRSVAYVRDDKMLLSKIFWSIFLFQFVLCMTSLAFYIVFIFFFVSDYKLIYIIQSLNLMAAAIDITWLFVGMEEFKKLVVRSIIFRVIGVICIFIFVLDSSDLWKYTAISSLSIILGQVVIWAYSGRIVYRYKVNYRDLLVHLKPSLQLFLPQIAIQVYLVLNKTMLGVLTNKQEVGLYESADKIIKMTLALLTATGGVMLPRVSNSFANGDKEKVDYYFYNVLNFVSYLGVPMMLGLAGISRQFVPWFFGSEFLRCSTLIVILCPVILIIGWSNVMGYQYMIPTKKTGLFTRSVFIGAFVNLTLNLLLIRKFYSAGAAIAATAAETAVTASQVYWLRKDIKITALLGNLAKYFLSSIVMLIPITFLGYFWDVSAKTTFIQIVVGITVYISMMFLLKSDINLFIFNRISEKLYRKLVRKEAKV